MTFVQYIKNIITIAHKKEKISYSQTFNNAFLDALSLATATIRCLVSVAKMMMKLIVRREDLRADMSRDAREYRDFECNISDFL